jgi:hypothetical protein
MQPLQRQTHLPHQWHLLIQHRHLQRVHKND